MKPRDDRVAGEFIPAGRLCAESLAVPSGNQSSGHGRIVPRLGLRCCTRSRCDRHAHSSDKSWYQGVAPVSGMWKRPLGSNRATSTGARPRSSANRPRRKSPYLMIQELESRTLLSVTASLSAGVLDVDLLAANDQATITPSGSSISVSGTGYTANSFSGVTAIVEQSANTSSQDDPNQGVTFEGSGGTIALDTESGTDALKVSGVTSVTFTGVTIDATSRNVDVEVSE